MKTISLKTFNTVGFTILILALTLIFSVSFSSCEKPDVATTTATLRTKEITLTSTAGNTVSGKAVIAENADHSFNVSITLQNTVKDTVMVMHIHNGSITAPGTIAIPLTNITGTGGQATGATLNIASGTSAANTTVALTYDNIITYAGYFNIHYSAAQITNVVANGNIQ
ncbi:MAG: hypothetical protein IPP81_09035 [Chitinophagaceae bacterium]|nr:hypothetical protein [Chitinophagaceae bacterium]